MVGRTIICIVGVLALAACGTQLEKAEQVEPKTDAHGEQLFEGYLALAKTEYGEGDYSDSDYFAARAILAGDNEKFEPQVISARDLPVERLNELAVARRKIVTALFRGAREKMPQDAADAQVQFDCWIQEQEENRQPDDIANCREAFGKTMGKISAVLAAAPVRIQSDDRMVFDIFFDFDSSELSDVAKEHVAAIADVAKTYENSMIAVIGNADQVGAADYNLELSQRRADAVGDLLKSAGVKLVGVFASGDQAPAVANPERRPEQLNRRTVVVIREKLPK